MNSVLGEQLATVQDIKNNSIEHFVWKGAKNSAGQTEKRLIDMSEAELNKCYQHCMSMLYNKDKERPGRYPLLKIIRTQQMKCNAELFLRWLENSYMPNDRRVIPRATYWASVNDCLTQNPNAFPKDKSLISITDVTSGVPIEFENLTLDYVRGGALNVAGIFNKKHMTLTFITQKLGLWFTEAERKEFTEEGMRCCKTNLELVRERCGLYSTVKIKVGPNSSLNFKMFRALVQLKNKAYADMTTDQLVVLRDKGLFFLAEEVQRHIGQWEELIEKIETVATHLGYKLTIDENKLDLNK